MVSIREVKRKIKEETERGVTADAAIELQNRIDMLVKGLIHLVTTRLIRSQPVRVSP